MSNTGKKSNPIKRFLVESRNLLSQNRRLFFFLFLIIISFVFLSSFKITTNYYFSGELGKELLYMRQFATSNKFPLVGMRTSHEWLSYGPVYYWLMIPLFNIFSGNPFILFYSALAVVTLGILINFWVVEQIADEKTALFTTLIASFSPIFLWQTRLSKLHVFFFLIIPIFVYLLSLLWKGQKKWLIPTGMAFGLLFSFHFSQIPLLGVVVLLFIFKRKIYKFLDWLYFGIGLIIPNLTLLWQDRKLFLWLPYRILNLSTKNPQGTINSLIEFFGKTIFWQNTLWLVGFLLFLTVFIHFVVKNKKKLTTDFLTFYLVSSISIILIANILHGGSPIHYFLPIANSVILLFAIYLSKFKFWPFVFVSIVFLNLYSFTQDPFFYKDFTGIAKNSDMVSFSTQEVVTSFIVSNASDKPFSIKRIGPFDYFPENYSQSYKYLILRKGGKLVDNAADVYTITENEETGEINVKK